MTMVGGELGCGAVAAVAVVEKTCDTGVQPVSLLLCHAEVSFFLDQDVLELEGFSLFPDQFRIDKTLERGFQLKPARLAQTSVGRRRQNLLKQFRGELPPDHRGNLGKV